MSKWPPSGLQVCTSKEEIFALIQQGYRLCVEADCCFMCEGYVKYGQDRPRIPVRKEAARAAVAVEDKSYGLREMTDAEVRDYLQLTPGGRKFYLAVM